MEQNAIFGVQFLLSLIVYALIAKGRHLRYASETPLANLHMSVLDKLGLPVETFGDSTGTLRYLSEV